MRSEMQNTMECRHQGGQNADIAELWNLVYNDLPLFFGLLSCLEWYRRRRRNRLTFVATLCVNKRLYACAMKHVRFCHLVTEHFVDNNREEHRAPRMSVAADRHRFNWRIRQIEFILAPVLTEKRSRLYIRLRNMSLMWNKLWTSDL